MAEDLRRRLINLFLADPGAAGRWPAFGPYAKFQDDPAWQDLLLLNEYFRGDTGTGLGASHWTALVLTSPWSPAGLRLPRR